MIRKYLSLVTAIGILYVYLLSQLRSGDALFLVTSSSLLINIVLLALAVAAVYISFVGKFKTAQAYIATSSASVLLSVMGLIGVAFSSLDNYFAGAIKPLDYLMFLQLGIIFSICSLSYKHQPVNIKSVAKLKLLRASYSQTFAGAKQQLANFIQSGPANTGRPSRAGNS